MTTERELSGKRLGTGKSSPSNAPGVPRRDNMRETSKDTVSECAVHRHGKLSGVRTTNRGRAVGAEKEYAAGPPLRVQLPQERLGCSFIEVMGHHNGGGLATRGILSQGFLSRGTETGPDGLVCRGAGGVNGQ